MLSALCAAKITAFLVVTGIGIYILNWLSVVSRHFKKFRLVGQVTELHCYPVSSCSGIADVSATCTSTGMRMGGAHNEQLIIGRESDNSFAVLSPKGTIKQYYKTNMRTIQTKSHENEVVLSIQGGRTFKIRLRKTDKPGKLIQLRRGDNIVAAVDLGNEAAKWLNEALGDSKLRLYQVVSNIVITTPGRCTLGNYIFTVTDSIKYINKTISVEPPLTPMYFRPNVVLSGSRPLDETKWSYIKISDVCFKISCSDSRIISTVKGTRKSDWKTALEPPPSLPKGFRVFDGSNFTADLGINAKVLTEGMIKIGDPVFAAY